MPIYEFYCPHCHRVLSFLSRGVNTQKTPACPRCGAADLARRASAFAISKRRQEPEQTAAAPGELDEARMEKAMETLAGEMEGVDENDPRQGAQLMRKLFAATGMPVASGMEEALRRMEAGEDPERIEEEMGDAFEGDPFGGLLGGEEGEAGSASEPAKAGLGRLRRMLPPAHDPELYEM